MNANQLNFAYSAFSSTGDINALLRAVTAFAINTAERRVAGEGQDLAQTVAVEVWQTLPKFDPTRRSFAGWVWMLTNSQVNKALRKRYLEREVIGETPTLDVVTQQSKSLYIDLEPEDVPLLDALVAGHSLVESARRLGVTRKKARCQLARIGGRADNTDSPIQPTARCTSGRRGSQLKPGGTNMSTPPRGQSPEKTPRFFPHRVLP